MTSVAKSRCGRWGSLDRGAALVRRAEGLGWGCFGQSKECGQPAGPYEWKWWWNEGERESVFRVRA